MTPKSENSQREFDFTLILTGITPETPGVEDALFAAGCDDATLAFRMNRPVLSFSRTAGSLKEAIFSAIADVRKSSVPMDVLRVDHCNLVTQADIARRTDRTRQSIQLYMSGQRGPGGFPGPACELSDGAWLWNWCEVAQWLWANDFIKEQDLQDAKDVDAINCYLEMQYQLSHQPALAKEIAGAVGVASK